MDCVSKLSFITQHSVVQKNVDRHVIESSEALVKPSEERVPEEYWHKWKVSNYEQGRLHDQFQMVDGKEKEMGNPVSAKLVPIKGIAGPKSYFLKNLVKAAAATKDYNAFDNEVVKAVIQHKWEKYVKVKFWKHRSLFMLLVTSLTIDAMFYREYKWSMEVSRGWWGIQP